ncbi:MAG TPA: hypothetical protein VL981_06340 [Candidatus Methylacidiphilales bacterium]|nr:hypothetical protein [Candidatus Methylacidiphilales bacterium]
MAQPKFLFLTLALINLCSLQLIAQAISPDRHWEITMAFESTPAPAASVSAVRLSDKSSQVLFEQAYNSRPGPEVQDLEAIKWTKDSKAFFIPIHGRRCEDFSVYGLEKGRWKEVLRDDSSSDERMVWNSVTGDNRYYLVEAEAWIRQNVLKWTFSRGNGNVAVFYHRLEVGPSGIVLRFVSGKIETGANGNLRK